MSVVPFELLAALRSGRRAMLFARDMTSRSSVTVTAIFSRTSRSQSARKQQEFVFGRLSHSVDTQKAEQTWPACSIVA